MKRTFAALVLATTFLTPVSATEYIAESQIDAVTVFPRGAEITRLTTVDLERGDHTLILDNLPAEIDPHSIRVEGIAGGDVEIASVDSKTVHVVDDASIAGERRRIEQEIEVLQDEHAALDQQILDAQYQRKLLQELASKPFAIQAETEKALQVSSTEFGNMFDLVSSRLVTLSKTVLDANINKRALNRKIGDLHTSLSQLAPKQRAKTVVTVHLASAAPAEGQFKVRYRIASAGWQPYYEARLTSVSASEPSQLRLVRRAEVTQSTTESWDGVKLTLSTARSTEATSAPELQPELISLLKEERSRSTGLYDMLKATPPPAVNEADAEQPAKSDDRAGKRYAKIAQYSQAEILIAGFQALYAINGRVSVDNTGTAKKVRITSDTLSATMSAHVVPKLDPNAYVAAKFTVDGESPLLRGNVMLFRDGVYMGKGLLPMLAAGEDYALGFGIDDRIKVKRIEVKRHTSETGLISTDRVEERSWAITVKNLHGTVMPVTVYDQMPYSTHEDIEVEMLSGSTKPSERDVDKKRGVVAWSYDLKQNQEQLIEFGYRITQPEDVRTTIGSS